MRWIARKIWRAVLRDRYGDLVEWRTWTDGTGQTLHNVHSPEICQGRPCVIHNPSDHHMREWPTHYRFDRRIMERICPHGIGHPDPDDPFTGRGIHGCDGCCTP